jgi:hypothetical protein
MSQLGAWLIVLSKPLLTLMSMAQLGTWLIVLIKATVDFDVNGTVGGMANCLN